MHGFFCPPFRTWYIGLLYILAFETGNEVDAGAEIWYIMYTTPMLHAVSLIMGHERSRDSYTSEFVRLGSRTQSGADNPRC